MKSRINQIILTSGIDNRDGWGLFQVGSAQRKATPISRIRIFLSWYNRLIRMQRVSWLMNHNFRTASRNRSGAGRWWFEYPSDGVWVENVLRMNIRNRNNYCHLPIRLKKWDHLLVLSQKRLWTCEWTMANRFIRVNRFKSGQRR